MTQYWKNILLLILILMKLQLNYHMIQGCFEENPEALLTVKDSQGNTITHLVAASGNTEVFEVMK